MTVCILADFNWRLYCRRVGRGAQFCVFAAWFIFLFFSGGHAIPISLHPELCPGWVAGHVSPEPFVTGRDAETGASGDERFSIEPPVNRRRWKTRGWLVGRTPCDLASKKA
ncbi:hypothetical protein VTJ04DRAFT_2672 [Mycothermus thermophilus]|uniref:uncharacterized protein n=1 Tax=Humicola insolens TaxID=85995 RepID=UPI003742E468